MAIIMAIAMVQGICLAVFQRTRWPKSRLKHGLDLLYFSGFNPRVPFQNVIYGIRSTWGSGSASWCQEKRNNPHWMPAVGTTTRHGSLVKSSIARRGTVRPYKDSPADYISFQPGWISTLGGSIVSIILSEHIGQCSDSNADTLFWFYGI